MAFEFKIHVNQILNEGAEISVIDVSTWEDSPPHPRADYALYLDGEYRRSTTPVNIVIENNAPLTSDIWIIPTSINARYSFTLHGFLTMPDLLTVEATGFIRALITSPYDLYISDGVAWTLITLEDAILADVAVGDDRISTEVLEVPLLSYAYAHKNILNLRYIERVKHDIDHGADQDRLYYTRNKLDYFSALILGAEFNWSIGSYFYFYQMLDTLDEIMNINTID